MTKNSYEYKRFMRDGSVKLTTAVVRSKKKEKPVADSRHSPK